MEGNLRKTSKKRIWPHQILFYVYDLRKVKSPPGKKIIQWQLPGLPKTLDENFRE